ncbi:uncharacterized protein BO66DRAFT_392546 [Aspergillus aculeatinus CBS 121060]|uniref:Uncharacterized protein n=1 Tax=Aspergillus aculeatinus CBS 121060 TaxID=1448322 RepID=A0ACD1H6D1_9EURO|nr:hypothetical protein BO66DRAFT_392546 [Aspergillus aculeatinus CBS 121060]RAH69348.1 hypothetical protein BO66DRAFT_392546 [Aspergillus aculeatinus CBS 121060]
MHLNSVHQLPAPSTAPHEHILKRYPPPPNLGKPSSLGTHNPAETAAHPNRVNPSHPIQSPLQRRQRYGTP